MKPAIPKRLSLAALCCVLMAAASQAQPQQKQQPLSSEELTSRSIQRRAVEAAIWGMPAVNFERMLQAVIANGGAIRKWRGFELLTPRFVVWFETLISLWAL